MRFDSKIKHPHKSEMTNLINTEEGVKLVYVGSIAFQLKELINRIHRAIDLMTKNLNLNREEKEGLLKLLDEINFVNNSDQIIIIIEKGLKLTDRFK